MAVSVAHADWSSPTFAAKMLGADCGAVSGWLGAYDHKGPDGLADDARPGRPPLVPRDKMQKIVGDTKRFTAYEFVGMVEKKTEVKYNEPHARRLLGSLGFAVKRTLRISDRVPPREELETWQKDTEKEVETLENDGFALVMADESRRNSNVFGTGSVYPRGTDEPVPMPLGNRRQTIYGGATLDGEACYMTFGKANDRSFIRYLDKLRHRLGKAAVLDIAAYHNLGRVRRYPEKNDDSIKPIFLPPYSPFLNTSRWLRRNGRAEMRRTLRMPARSYFR